MVHSYIGAGKRGTLAFQIVYGESLRVSFEITRWVKRNSIEQSLLIVVRPAVHASDFFHCLFVDVRAHHLFGDAFIVRRARNHSPAAELGEPPFAIFWLGIIAVALAENHVVVVLFFASVTVVVVA